MLDIMGGVDRVHRGIGDIVHIGDAGDQVRADRWIDIQADFSPGGAAKQRRELIGMFGAAADVQHLAEDVLPDWGGLGAWGVGESERREGAKRGIHERFCQAFLHRGDPMSVALLHTSGSGLILG